MLAGHFRPLGGSENVVWHVGRAEWEGAGSVDALKTSQGSGTSPTGKPQKGVK